MTKWAVLALLLLSTLAPGCVERALVVTSEPSGAEITVNQQWKGTTPFVLPFKHYGVYDIWIQHPGLEEDGRLVKFYPLHVGEPVKAPGYQYAGMDFVTEVLLPSTLRDQHNLHYILERVDEADQVDDVLARASQLRMASRTRTEMRYAKDMQSGRISDASEFYTTPPTPSEVPVFTPEGNPGELQGDLQTFGDVQPLQTF